MVDKDTADQRIRWSEHLVVVEAQEETTMEDKFGATKGAKSIQDKDYI